MGLFRKGKTYIIAKFHRTDLVICSHSREGKTPSYSQMNTVDLVLEVLLSSQGSKQEDTQIVEKEKKNNIKDTHTLSRLG